MLDYDTRAVQLREEQHMGVVGNAIDRRALRQLSLRFDDDHLHSLICFVCGQIYTDVSGSVSEGGPFTASGHEVWTRYWYPPSRLMPTQIRYYSVAHTLEKWKQFQPEGAVQEVNNCACACK